MEAAYGRRCAVKPADVRLVRKRTKADDSFMVDPASDEPSEPLYFGPPFSKGGGR